MSERIPIASAAGLVGLDPDEIVDGYRDGLAGEPEPGDNRSVAYWHGWRNGRSDRAGTSDAAQQSLARSHALQRQREIDVQKAHDRIAARFPNVLDALAESERADLHSSVNTGKEDTK